MTDTNKCNLTFICPSHPGEIIKDFTDLLYHTWAVHDKRNIMGNTSEEM